MHYRQRAEQDRKTIRYLEEPLEGLACFEHASEEELREFLRIPVEEPERSINELDRLINGWRQSNIDDLGNFVIELADQFPTLYGALLFDRNYAWIPSIRAAVESDERALILVGALHCVGPDSIPELLGREGLSLTRL